MSTIHENINKASDLFTNLIKTGKLKLSAADMPADSGEGVESQSKIETETADGTKLIIYGDVAQGTKISTVSADGTELPAQDGELVMKDGSTITVKDGLIESVTPTEAMKEEEQKFDAQKEFSSLSERLKSLEERYEASQSENQELKKELASHKDALGNAFAALEIISGLPASKPVEEKFTAAKPNNRLDEIAATIKKIKSVA